MFTLLLAQLALAGDAIQLSITKTGTPGGEPPSLVVHPNVSGEVAVSLTCNGRRFNLQQRIQPGAEARLALAGLPNGPSACTGTLDLTDATGATGSMPLQFEVAMAPPVQLELVGLDLEARTVTVRPNQPVSEIRIEVIGLGGSLLGGGPVSGVMHDEDVIQRSWEQQPGEVLQVKVHTTTAHGATGLLELTPWSYDIPHEDVVFASAEHVIPETEHPKLEATWKELEAVVARYGDIIEVQLFVVGHTDSVGTVAANQALSERRAQAIAAWFTRRGFNGKVWYQGLGESALLIPTPDETANASNRRATYILAAHPPAPAEGRSASGWKPLR